VVERFLLDGVDAESTRTAVSGQDNRVMLASANEAEAPLAFVKTAEPRTDIASDAAVVEESPVEGGVGRHT
jgi:hypothetical protein